MDFDKQHAPSRIEPDMTPMIDVTFQLIIFFLLTLNFSMDEQSERIRLPMSELAKPAAAPLVAPLTLQLTAQDTVIIGGDEVTIANLRAHLLREKDALVRDQRRDPREATVVIRADQDARAGVVQELIKACQETGFERFALRAKQDPDAPTS